MATSAPYDPYELTPNSHKMMLAALLKHMQPNPSPVGAAANALSMGLMGLIENNDEKQKIAGMDAQILGTPPAQSSVPAVSSPMGNIPPVSDASPRSAPTLSPQTPTRPMISDYPTGPATAAALRGGPSEADMAANDVADSLSATGMKVSPEAVARLMKVESNNDPRNVSGSYAGATQMGPDTFKEAGGRLGGMTYPEYKNGSLTQQAWAYPDWLQQYNVPGKLAAAGVDTGSMTPAMQYGTLQAAQFAPNGGAAGNAPPQWMTALGQGNPNVPSTTTPQANVLGNKSVAAMAGSFPQTQMADASGNVSIPRGAQLAGPANPQIAQAQPQAPTIPAPSPVYMQMNEQTNKMIEQYRNATPSQKAILGPQILLQQNEMRKMEQELQKQEYLKNKVLPAEADPNYLQRLENMKADVKTRQELEVDKGKQLQKIELTKEQQRPGNAATSGLIHDQVDRAIKQIDAHPNMTTGWGSYLAAFPGAARDLQGNLSTVGSLATISTLNEMRAASPTGGALGSISNYEDKMLAAAKGNLDQAQNPEQLKYNLQRLERVMTTIANPTGKTIAEQEDAVRKAFGDGAPARGNQQQGAQPAAPQSSYQEGQTATGPNGQKITFRNGRWQ